MVLTHQYQLIKVLEGPKIGTLYQGCHPSIYGHDIAWKNVDVIVDLDNGPEEGYYNGANAVQWHAFPPIMPENCMYVRWKIEDGNTPDKRYLKSLGKLIAGLIQSKQSVLVHCAAGQNRSALVTACALYYLTGESGDFLYKYMRSVNPICLTNYSFRNFVQTIEEHLNAV